MKVTEVEARVGVTVNLGNFESLRIDYGMTADLESGDTPSNAIDRMRNHLCQKIADDLAHSNGGKDFIK